MLDLERYGDMLGRVKMLQPLPETNAYDVLTDDSDEEIQAKKEAQTKRKELYENLLEFSLSKIIQDVANYTNIPVDELPPELDNDMVGMVVTMLDTHNLLSKLDGNDDTSGIQSLNEGDTSITFRSKADIYTALQNINPITDNYINLLNNFRKVKW